MTNYPCSPDVRATAGESYRSRSGQLFDGLIPARACPVLGAPLKHSSDLPDGETIWFKIRNRDYSVSRGCQVSHYYSHRNLEAFCQPPAPTETEYPAMLDLPRPKLLAYWSRPQPNCGAGCS